MFGLNRGVAEQYDANDDESDPELFGFNPIERTGLSMDRRTQRQFSEKYLLGRRSEI